MTCAASSSASTSSSAAPTPRAAAGHDDAAVLVAEGVRHGSEATPILGGSGTDEEEE